MWANYWDYVVKGNDGVCYPVESELFEKTYEVVE